MSRLIRAWCSCGWHGDYDTQRRADYAIRRHSCDKARREAERRRRIAERKANLDRTPQPCTHKIARHEHGTYERFTLDHCHCDPCRNAKLTYEAERRRRKAYGHQPYVDARPAAEHVRALMAAGMGWKRVARAAGLAEAVVYPLLYGRHDRNGGKPRTKARKATVDAILAVPLPTLDNLAAGLPTNPTGTARRVQALACLGWSVGQVATHAGVDRQAIDRALRGQGITVSTARAVRDAYDRLWNAAPPESDQHERIAASRTRNRATRLGWVPPVAWDDDAIDDPDATPAVVDSDKRQGADLDEFLFLVRTGEHPARAASRLGVSLGAIERAAIRNQRQDVMAWVYGRAA